MVVEVTVVCRRQTVRITVAFLMLIFVFIVFLLKKSSVPQKSPVFEVVWQEDVYTHPNRFFTVPSSSRWIENWRVLLDLKKPPIRRITEEKSGIMVGTGSVEINTVAPFFLLYFFNLYFLSTCIKPVRCVFRFLFTGLFLLLYLVILFLFIAEKKICINSWNTFT